MSDSIQFLACITHGQTYLFFWHRGDENRIYAQLTAWANDPDMVFTFYDAAVLAGRIRNRIEQYDL